VRDLAATNAILPLFRSYNDKERFDRAVSWLRVDLEQLLQTRGVTFDPSRSLLANLVQLAQCDVCPSLAY
jgi:Asp-tRNA(Asn)/Glu-tRNA(Gln) amidotransferase B subunit